MLYKEAIKVSYIIIAINLNDVLQNRLKCIYDTCYNRQNVYMIHVIIGKMYI